MKTRIKSITIETEGFEGENLIKIDVDNAEVHWKYGHITSYLDGRPILIEPNGDEIIEIKAWKGCKSYESFTVDGEGGK